MTTGTDTKKANTDESHPQATGPLGLASKEWPWR